MVLLGAKKMKKEKDSFHGIIKNRFSERLKELRTSKKMNQKTLSAIFGYGATAISGYENGRNEPSYDMLIQFARYFDVTVDFLIGNEDYSKRLESMTKTEFELLQVFRILSADERKLIYMMAMALNKLEDED